MCKYYVYLHMYIDHIHPQCMLESPGISDNDQARNKRRYQGSQYFSEIKAACFYTHISHNMCSTYWHTHMAFHKKTAKDAIAFRVSDQLNSTKSTNSPRLQAVFPATAPWGRRTRCTPRPQWWRLASPVVQLPQSCLGRRFSRISPGFVRGWG